MEQLKIGVDGLITTIAGAVDGTHGNAGDGGLAVAALLEGPHNFSLRGNLH